jgi:uncharacterized NAD(P)/FAD-binding protein YdhS
MTKRPTVAIIGAGFSGLLTALHLLRNAEGPNVRLIERRGAFARGTAYSTVDPDHFLNVRASNMSAFPDDPPHFVRWLSSTGDDQVHGHFVRRNQFGDYLQSLIQEALETSAAGRFLLEPDEAVAIDKVTIGWTVTLAMGRTFNADAVVLAVGNLPPNFPTGFASDLVNGPHYVANPWNLENEDLPLVGSAVLVGTGLSMIDVALHLARVRPKLRMLAMSRRGLLPRRHLAEGPQPLTKPPPADKGVLALLMEMRQRARTEDWRAVLDGFRPYVNSVWNGWSSKERKRFLRHCRPWWDVHRHRLAPQVAAKIDHLVATGMLRVSAGRILSVKKEERALKMVWRPRAARGLREESVSVVINCAGPNGDPAVTDDLLLAHLVQRGLIRSEPQGLGLDIDVEGRLIGWEGQAASTFFALGPLTRGRLWETTSVPDIRVQALECAANVLATLHRAQATQSIVR